jgi:hypothetical protein
VRARLLVAAVGLVALSAACSEEGTTPQVHASRTVEYHSLKQAARDADAVVEIAVERTGEMELVGSVPFTVTEARVVDVLKGSVAGEAIRLRQLGADSPDGLVAEGELLEAGEHYVALVVPFVFDDFRPTDQHVVVGGWQGLYRVEGDMLVATDKAPTALPRRLTRSSFKAEVTAS